MFEFSGEDKVHKCMSLVPCSFFAIAPRYLIYHSRGSRENFLLGLTTRFPSPFKSWVNIGTSNKVHVGLLNRELTSTLDVGPAIILAIGLQR
jgi:hypothetical protein